MCIKFKTASVCAMCLLGASGASIVEGSDSKDLALQEMMPLNVSRSVQGAEESAEFWTKRILSDPYDMRPNVKYVFIPATTNNKMDLLRVRYIVDGNTITITQSRTHFLIIVNLLEKHGELSRAERELLVVNMFSKMFRCSSEVEIKSLSIEEGRSEGVALRPGVGLPPYSYQKKGEILERMKAPWLQEMFWWYESSEIGFSLIKKTGTPPSLLLPARSSKGSWFSNDNRLSEQLPRTKVKSGKHSLTLEEMIENTNKRVMDQSPNPSE